jgi:hypothetical protein
MSFPDMGVPMKVGSRELKVKGPPEALSQEFLSFRLPKLLILQAMLCKSHPSSFHGDRRPHDE